MSSSSNQEFTVAQRPQGLPDDKTFKLESKDVPAAADGQIAVKALYISVDPYLRGVLGHTPVPGPFVSGQVAEVVESKSNDYKAGDKVFFYGRWARFQNVDPASADAKLQKIDSDAHLSAYLGVLGMPGATAYFGLKEAAAFKKGDVVLVSGAAGAVGSAVGQLAKLWGAKKVIGTAGGEAKCKLVVEKYGFDECIDYKKFDTEEKVTAELKRISPEGCDVHFDNVGGHVSDAFLNTVRKFGRVAVCGSISQYNDAKPPQCPSPWGKVIYTSVRIQGFIVFDYFARWQEFIDTVHPLVKEGKIKFEETVVEGFEKLPEALNGLFKGANVGKMVVKI